MAARGSRRLSFLDMPGEIRNKIYHGIYESTSEPEKMDEIIPAYGAPGYQHLLALMRACRRVYPLRSTLESRPNTNHILEIHHETTSLLYSPTYILFNSDSEIEFNLSFILSSSASHLRNVRVQYDYGPFFDYYGPRYEKSFLDLSILTALSTASPNLEVLEIGFARQFKVYSTRYHPVFEICEYSWVDEPMELPFGGYEAVKSPHRITQEQVDGMVEYVKGVMVGEADGMRRVEGEMRTSEGYRREAWKKLVMFEDHKRFFGVNMLEVLKGFRGLREVRMCGTVDEKWMRAVAERLRVTVRAREEKEVRGELIKGEWVVVGSV
jgi:hypothetical protein